MATFGQGLNEPNVKLFDKNDPSSKQNSQDPRKDNENQTKFVNGSDNTTSLGNISKSSFKSDSKAKILTFEQLVDKLTLPSARSDEVVIKPLPITNELDKSSSFILTTASKESILSSSSTQSLSSSSLITVKSDIVPKKAKIHSVEELLDSSSDLDLDLPLTPPTPSLPNPAKRPSEHQLITFPVTVPQPFAHSPVLVESISVSLKIPPNLDKSVVTPLPVAVSINPPPPDKSNRSHLENSSSEKMPLADDSIISDSKEQPEESVNDSETTLETVIIPEIPKREFVSTGTLNCPSTHDRKTNTGSPTITSAGISINHYERLIEELKCPGCASPMKAPIRLCTQGHSICERCTTTLMLCPLCKEPFTEMRSLTLEALSSKALFRCSNASAGCKVRLQQDLLSWHEKQCVWKPMKCFMGRVWGNCSWTGREASWKEHLEAAHSDKVFKLNQVDLKWNLNGKVKSLAGYYVFEVYDELFNFYQVYDKDRILFTMTITSTVRERKHNYSYEVELFHKDNEALSITQRFPVHSEYDPDILLDGTCVSVNLADLLRLLGREKIINFHVRINEVKSPGKKKTAPLKPSRKLPLNFKQTNIEGANLKCVPPDRILTRQIEDVLSDPTKETKDEKDETDESSSDDDVDAYNALGDKNWGTPQLNFNRKFLCENNTPTSSSSSSSTATSTETPAANTQRDSLCEVSGNKNKMKNVTSNLRKSFRSLKTDIIELKRPFVSRTLEKKETLIRK